MLQKISIFRYTFLDKADDSLLVDEISHPAAAIFAFDVLLGVGNERKADILFFDKFFKGLHIVVADPDNLRVEFLECFQITLEVSKLACSD